MTFQTNGTTAIDVLMGDKAFIKTHDGESRTYTYKSDDLVDLISNQVEAGSIQLISLKADDADFPDKAFIIDYSTEYVMILDQNGKVCIAPIIMHNQGAMFTIRWDSEETDILDETGKND